jgi:hypothetical protein
MRNRQEHPSYKPEANAASVHRFKVQDLPKSIDTHRDTECSPHTHSIYGKY